MFGQAKESKKKLINLFLFKSRRKKARVKGLQKFAPILGQALLKKNLLVISKPCSAKKKKYSGFLLAKSLQKRSYFGVMRQDSKTNISYIQHYLNMFLQGGKGYQIEILYKRLLAIHKQYKINFLLNLFIVIRYLQFFLLLKGYRYRVGRGVVKVRHFLTPISVLRQYFLSFFYILAGVKKRREACYHNRVFLEFFQLIFFGESQALQVISNLYLLAQQARMFIPSKKRILFKRSPRAKKKSLRRLRSKFFFSNFPYLIGNCFHSLPVIQLQLNLRRIFTLHYKKKRLISLKGRSSKRATIWQKLDTFLEKKNKRLTRLLQVLIMVRRLLGIRKAR